MNTQHYVYELENTLNGMKYIGCRSYEGNPVDDKYYFGSSTLMPVNKRDICTKTILSTFNTRHEAQSEKTRLLNLHDVTNNDLYYNRKISSPSEHCVGYKPTQAHKDNLAAAWVGRVVSDETKVNMSVAKSGANNPRFGKTAVKRTCEHCDKTVGNNMYVRWHGSNCKSLNK